MVMNPMVQRNKSLNVQKNKEIDEELMGTQQILMFRAYGTQIFRA